MKILLNDKPIQYNADNLNFYATQYYDNSLAIICETEYQEPYATVTINLSQYGEINSFMIVVALNHDLSDGLRDIVINIFAKDSIPVQYGYTESFLITIKDEYIKKIIGGLTNEV